ncbi:MAG: hypothetical protein ACLF0G_00555 [Candidatus Brocadiia bacterium]
MRRSPAAVYVSVFLVGFCGLIAQVVVVREMVVTFYGNELSIGVMLGSWLLWTGLGSLVLGRLTAGTGRPRLLLAAVLLLGALVVVPTVAGARGLKLLVGLPRGAVADFLADPLGAADGLAFFRAWPRGALWRLSEARESAVGAIRPFRVMLVSTLALLAPFCLLNGLLFPTACRAAAGEGTAHESTGRVYLLEAAGAAAGGAAYSFVLVSWVNPLSLAFALAAAWCAASAWLGASVWRPWAAKALVVLAACQLGRLGQALGGGRPGDLATAMDRAYWRPFVRESTTDSRYGRVTVLRPAGRSRLRTLYRSGAVAFSYPDPPAAEAVAHPPMLQHPEPESVLLLGGGLNGTLAEILKHPSVEEVTYVELDRCVVEAVRAEFPAGAAQPLADDRTELRVADGRALLKHTARRFDVVIAAQPPPETAQANRFYTLGFFREVDAVLAPGGVFAFRAACGHNVVLEENRPLLATLRATLAEVFPAVRIWPGALCTFFASNRKGVLVDPREAYLERFQPRGLEWTTSHTLAILEDAWPEERHQMLAEVFQAIPDPPLNRDLAPRCYYFEAQRWSAIQERGLAQQPTPAEGAGPRLDLGRILEALARRPALGPLAVLGAVALVAAAVPLALRRGGDAAVQFAVSGTGFIEMAVEFGVLLGFQVAYGYVYQYVGILVAAFMLGLALGAGLSSRWVARRGGTWRRMLCVQGAVCAYPLALLGFLVLATRTELAASAVFAAVSFTLMALAAGLMGGLQFPLAVALHSRGSDAAGTLYGLDLFGSCLGALAVSSVLVPLFGLTGLCAMLAGLGALGLVALGGAGWAAAKSG